METSRGERGVEQHVIPSGEHAQDAVEQARLVGGEGAFHRGQPIAEAEAVEFQLARSCPAARRRSEHLEPRLGEEVLDAPAEELAIERVDEGACRLELVGLVRRRVLERDLGGLESLPIHVAPRPGLARLHRPHERVPRRLEVGGRVPAAR